MTYQAIITPLVNVRPHGNADRLRLATVCGHQIITSLDKEDGELGIFFPSDGRLTHEMLVKNTLYQKNPETGETMGGYFGKNGRVRAQNFRGEKSDGFWIELGSVAWTGVNLEELKEGEQFTHLNGVEVCKKYINPATLRAARMNKQKGTARRRLFEMLKPHFDTPQLRYEIHTIPAGSIIYLSEKIHGTSGRTGHILAEQLVTGFKGWWNRHLGEKTRLTFKPRMEWQVISGTRRVVLDPKADVDLGYYSGKTFRVQIHKMFELLEIPKGVTFYYEIVGYDEQGGQLMPSHSVEKIGDKKLRKQVKKLYGDQITYSYGCHTGMPYRVIVYRVTMTNPDGEVIDYSWPQVKEICGRFGLETVPELSDVPQIFCKEDEAFDFGCDKVTLAHQVEIYLDQPSRLDESHILEGVCVRAEQPDGRMRIMKDKGYLFKVLEGIVKSDPDIVDIEEAEDLSDCLS